MAETIVLIDSLRFLIGTLILAYASYTDIKTRTASNYLWVILGGLGGVLLLVQYLTVGFENIMLLIFIPIMIGLMYLFFQLRLIFGGADAKALMAIAVLVPLQPDMGSLPVYSQSFMPGSWIVFSNSVILFLIIPISLIIINMIHRNFEFPYMFVGYRMKIKKARETFVWPLEKIVDGERKFVRMPEDFEIDDELDLFEKLGIDEIWVTPKIPFIIPLLGGYMFTYIFGDILSAIMYNIMY